MNEFKIEKNVPCPQRGHANALYPFAVMEVGDSFLAKGVPHKKVLAASCAHARRHDKGFACRRQPCGNSRVWRIK